MSYEELVNKESQLRINEEYQKAQISDGSHRAKKECDLEMHHHMNQDDIQKTMTILEKTSDFNERQMLKRYAVTLDQEGRLFYGLADSKNVIRNSVPICQGKFPDVQVFWSVYPERHDVIVVNIPGASTTVKFQDYSTDPDMGAKKFFRSLQNHGFQLGCRKAVWEEVAEAAYTFILNRFIPVEIPGMFGWNKMSDDHWIYADDESKTMFGGILS